MKIQKLNYGWSLVLPDGKIPASVPGSVVCDLLAAGKIEDPFYRTNEYAVRDLFENDYEYRASFTPARALLNKERLELVCLGLDTVAEITLNGQLIAKTDNMHRTWRFPVALKKGKNDIRILFRSPLKYIREAMESCEDEIRYVPSGGIRGNQFIRKAHSQFGWDWGPQLIDAGIWRDIQLEGWNGSRLDNALITQRHENNRVLIEIAPEFDDLTDRAAAPVKIHLYDPDGQLIYDTPEMTLVIDNPKLWWPNNLGEQPLYRLELESGEQVITKYVGLRTLTVSRERDEWGREFCFVVNGRKVFAMGGNYIPEDSVYPRITPERTEKLISDCAAANHNCIRVWGGGYYPADDFYDACDRYGLIVWQDHLFACNIYSFTNELRDSVAAELRDNVRRLRHHASLGLWCGNNEMESGWAGWPGFVGHSQKLRSDYIKQFEVTVPDVTRENDPYTFYWPSSPSSGGSIDRPDDESDGDAHYWAVWHGRKPFSDYSNHYFRFCSEYGFQSFPCLETVESFTAPEDRNIFSEVMESHQKNGSANGVILSYLSENFLYPKDLGSLLYVSQLLQAEAMRVGAEHFRRHRGRCMGSLYWQVNDCWPVASWAGIDSFGRWKALHYFSRRFYAPQTMSVETRGGVTAFWAVNELSKDFSGELTIEHRRRDFTLLSSETVPVACPAESSAVVAERAFEREKDTYVSWKLNGRHGGSELFVPPKHFNFAKPRYMVSTVHTIPTDEHPDGLTAIIVKSDSFARFVELSGIRGGAALSDNYFDITDERGVTIMASGMINSSDVKVRSLGDSY